MKLLKNRNTCFRKVLLICTLLTSSLITVSCGNGTSTIQPATSDSASIQSAQSSSNVPFSNNVTAQIEGINMESDDGAQTFWNGTKIGLNQNNIQVAKDSNGAYVPISSVAASDGSIYVAFADAAYGGKASIVKIDIMGNTSHIATGFSSNVVTNISIILDSSSGNIPVVGTVERTAPGSNYANEFLYYNGNSHWINSPNYAYPTGGVSVAMQTDNLNVCISYISNYNNTTYVPMIDCYKKTGGASSTTYPDIEGNGTAHQIASNPQMTIDSNSGTVIAYASSLYPGILQVKRYNSDIKKPAWQDICESPKGASHNSPSASQVTEISTVRYGGITYVAYLRDNKYLSVALCQYNSNNTNPWRVTNVFDQDSGTDAYGDSFDNIVSNINLTFDKVNNNVLLSFVYNGIDNEGYVAAVKHGINGANWDNNGWIATGQTNNIIDVSSLTESTESPTLLTPGDISGKTKTNYVLDNGNKKHIIYVDNNGILNHLYPYTGLKVVPQYPKNIMPQESEQFTAIYYTVNPTTNALVSTNVTTLSNWVSESPAIADMSTNNSGLVIGSYTDGSPNSTVISASYINSSGESFSNGVVLSAVEYNVEITPDNQQALVNQQIQLTATKNYQDPDTGNESAVNFTQEVQWVSESPAIATISNDIHNQGIVTGISPGTTIIDAVSEYDKTTILASTTVKIVNGIVKITPSNSYVGVNGNEQLAATYTYMDNGSIITTDITKTATWASNATNVALVNTSGLVTGENLGNASISATYNDESSSAKVIVQNVASKCNDSKYQTNDFYFKLDDNIESFSFDFNYTSPQLYGAVNASNYDYNDTCHLVSTYYNAYYTHKYKIAVDTDRISSDSVTSSFNTISESSTNRIFLHHKDGDGNQAVTNLYFWISAPSFEINGNKINATMTLAQTKKFTQNPWWISIISNDLATTKITKYSCTSYSLVGFKIEQSGLPTYYIQTVGTKDHLMKISTENGCSSNNMHNRVT